MIYFVLPSYLLSKTAEFRRSNSISQDVHALNSQQTVHKLGRSSAKDRCLVVYSALNIPPQGNKMDRKKKMNEVNEVRGFFQRDRYETQMEAN